MVSPIAFNHTYLNILPVDEFEAFTSISFFLQVMVSGGIMDTTGFILSSTIVTNNVSEELKTVLVAISLYNPGQLTLILVVP